MRYFLIDKVTELVVGERVRGVKNVTLTDEVLHDHFPDHPVMPGALILEAASQLAGFLLETTWNRAGEPLRRALLVQIDLAKFHDFAGPGDQLDIAVKLDSLRESAAQVTATVMVGSGRIAQAGLTFMLKVIDSERIHEQRRYLYKLWTKDLKTPVTIL
jgi:3-hydroxyacyl-[acyl-carrier-protein] dehydratase